MKIVEGRVDNLPTTVHVEQDGNYFFVLPRKDAFGEFTPALAVLDSETHVGFDMASGKAAQDVIRDFLTKQGVAATFDY